MRFCGDKTYLISDWVWLDTAIFEGSSVLKFPSDGGGALIPGALICEGSPYRMTALTSANDRSCGEDIPGSTGNPLADVAGPSEYVQLYSNPTDLKYVRISYAPWGVISGYPMQVSHCQLVHCGTAIYCPGGGLH